MIWDNFESLQSVLDVFLLKSHLFHTKGRHSGVVVNEQRPLTARRSLVRVLGQDISVCSLYFLTVSVQLFSG